MGRGYHVADVSSCRVYSDHAVRADFEIGLTRIYSATIWYHFTFVAVSVALLGWGLGGLALHVASDGCSRRSRRPASSRPPVGRDSALPWLVAHLPATLDRLPVYFIAPLLPFFLAGMALSMIFDLRRHLAASLYFADLLGASLGALGVTFLLQFFGGEAACCSRRWRR